MYVHFKLLSDVCYFEKIIVTVLWPPTENIRTEYRWKFGRFCVKLNMIQQLTNIKAVKFSVKIIYRPLILARFQYCAQTILCKTVGTNIKITIRTKKWSRSPPPTPNQCWFWADVVAGILCFTLQHWFGGVGDELTFWRGSFDKNAKKRSSPNGFCTRLSENMEYTHFVSSNKDV